MLNLNIFIPRMASTLFHDGQSYLKYDQCNVHVNTQHRQHSENKSNTHITFLWEHGWCMKVDSGLGWSGRWLWHIILNPRWKCLRWCYLRMSDHQRSVMCNVSDYPLHNCGRWWWLMTCIITHPSPQCHPPPSPASLPRAVYFALLIWFGQQSVKSNLCGRDLWIQHDP